MFILSELYLTVILLIGLLGKPNLTWIPTGEWKTSWSHQIVILVLVTFMILTNEFHATIKLLMVVFTLLVIAITNGQFTDYFNSYTLVITSLVGLLLMVSSEDLVSLYLAMELYSLSVYILATYYGEGERIRSAGLKYFMLGALQSGLMILGTSLIYISTGEFEINSVLMRMIDSLGFPLDTLISSNSIPIQVGLDNQPVQGLMASDRFGAPEASTLNSLWNFGAEPEGLLAFGKGGLMMGMGILVAVFLFKVGAAPFHFWVADVYDSVEIRVANYLMIVPKLGLIWILASFASMANSKSVDSVFIVIQVAAVLSLVLGSILGLVQTRIRKLLVYSGISHIGYLLMASLSFDPLRMILIFYLFIYGIITLNFFGCLLSFRHINWLDELRFLPKNNFYLALVFSLTLFSMAGTPPLAGFVAKLFVYSSSLDSEFYGLAFLAIITSVISTGYYLNLMKIAYFSSTEFNGQSNLILKVSKTRAILLSIGTNLLLFFMILSPSFMYLLNWVFTSLLT